MAVAATLLFPELTNVGSCRFKRYGYDEVEVDQRRMLVILYHRYPLVRHEVNDARQPGTVCAIDLCMFPAELPFKVFQARRVMHYLLGQHFHKMRPSFG